MTLSPCGHWTTASFPFGPHAATRLKSDAVTPRNCAAESLDDVSALAGIGELPRPPEHAESTATATAMADAVFMGIPPTRVSKKLTLRPLVATRNGRAGSTALLSLLRPASLPPPVGRAVTRRAD